MTPELAGVLTWVSVCLWLGIAATLLVLSVMVHGKTRTLLRVALELGNGKVARGRLWASRRYLQSGGLALVLGSLSAFSALYMPHPEPDTRAVTAFIRFSICYLLFCVLVTKIENLRTFRGFAREGEEAELRRTARDVNQDQRDQRQDERSLRQTERGVRQDERGAARDERGRGGRPAMPDLPKGTPLETA